MQYKTCFCLFISLLILLAACSSAGGNEPALEATGTPAVTSEPIVEAVAPTPPDNNGDIEPAAAFDGTLAYIQDQALIIQHSDGERVTVETCPQDANCITQFLKWAPNGQQLLYYYYDGTDDSLRLADQFGQVQVVTDNTAFALPGDWSPDGQTVVFLRPTGEHIEGSETNSPFDVHEVWTAVLDASGMVQEPQLVGSTNYLSNGCGGGGRSASEILYENEGGTAYGYLMGVLEWTGSGTLLYTNNCTNFGINRFDMNSGTDLPPVEPLFYGSQSHKLYYTTREFIANAEISDFGAYFNFFKPALWQINQDDSQETLLWQGEDQAYAQVSETADGDLLFVWVENDQPLYEALQNGSATMDEMGEFAPQRHIMRLTIGSQPQTVISNAGQPQIAFAAFCSEQTQP